MPAAVVVLRGFALCRGNLSPSFAGEMSLLPFGELPRPARRFLPARLDLGDWAQIEPWFDRLEANLDGCSTAAAFEGWLLDWGELSAAVDQEGALRHIAMTCHTDDPDAEKAYLRFVETVEPAAKPRQFRLCERYLCHPLRGELSPDRYRVFDRDTALRVEVYREANVPLETEESRLGNEFQKLTGSLTVQHRGVERTLPQMAVFQEDLDRAAREEAWRLVAGRRLEAATVLDDLFEQFTRLRSQMAANAGHANYRDYAFRLRGRFDYGPDDCLRFHEAIEAEVVPVLAESHAARRRKLAVDALRPWDLAVDLEGQPRLQPYADAGELEAGAQRMFDRLDDGLAAGFQRMRDLRLLDLANRKGKAPGGYQSTLAEARLPFIFMNGVGLQRDVETLAHEAGHAFHALAAGNEPLYAYRGAPIEFCEVASMAMELLTAPLWDEFYGEADARRARRAHLEGIIGVFPWIAAVDAFQHWLYTHPSHSRDERGAAWAELARRFGGLTDWTGLEPMLERQWHKQLHIFLYPFYYVEYGIAQLGALQLWAASAADPARALADYKAGLALGGSRTLPELFSRAGCRFDFSRETLRPLMRRVREELSGLGGL